VSGAEARQWPVLHLGFRFLRPRSFDALTAIGASGLRLCQVICRVLHIHLLGGLIAGRAYFLMLA
jgi:hypothetical protein